MECHGTGTAIGDKVEIQALGRCFVRREAAPLLVGSVSTCRFEYEIITVEAISREELTSFRSKRTSGIAKPQVV